MIKNLLLLVFCLFIGNMVYGQKGDTTVYYLRSISDGAIRDYFDYGIRVEKNEDATFMRLIISPVKGADTLYQVMDYYLNGRLKLTGKSTTSNFQVNLQGTCMEYYPNGHKKKVFNFYKGARKEIRSYFPNGKLNTIKTNLDYTTTQDTVLAARKLKDKNFDSKKYVDSASQSVLQYCQDSTGKVLTENGNGRWVEYNQDDVLRIDEGIVVNGQEDGEWHGQLNDTLKYKCQYKSGHFIEGTSYGASGRKYPFKKINVAPEFNGGNKAFGEYLSTTIIYPNDARRLGKHGRVIVSFTVDKNGVLSAFDLIKRVYPSIDAEALRAMNFCPNWTPGYYYGVPKSARFSVPITFTLENK